MGRAPCCDKANVKRGPWSPEEDEKLKDYMDKHGTGGNWIAFPQKAGLRRCGKSCRLRWLNYLRPNIKHGEFSDDEDRIICTLFASIGSRWSIIAAQLPGRTDNDIKNYWNTKLKKKLLGRTLNQYLPWSNTNNHSIPQNYSMVSPYSSIHSQISQAYECGNSNYYPSMAFTTPNSTTTTAPSLLQQAQDGCFPTQVSYNQLKQSNKSNFLMFGREAASCGSSAGSQLSQGRDQVEREHGYSGSAGDNLGHLQSYFNNGVDESQKLLIGEEKVVANGCYGGNALDYSIEEIKQLISTKNVCSNNLNYFVNGIKTEENEIYY